jgi:hypothetical protein
VDYTDGGVRVQIPITRKGLRKVGKMTIYVRDEDEGLFEKAKALADEGSLSQVLARALKDFLDKREAESEGMREWVLLVGEPGLQHKIGFIGKKVAEWPDNDWVDDMPQEGEFDDQDWYRSFTTRKGKILLYTANLRGGGWGFKYDVFDTFQDFERALGEGGITDGHPIFGDTARALGEIEYLDI